MAVQAGSGNVSPADIASRRSPAPSRQAAAASQTRTRLVSAYTLVTTYWSQAIRPGKTRARATSQAVGSATSSSRTIPTLPQGRGWGFFPSRAERRAHRARQDSVFRREDFIGPRPA